MLFIEVSSLNSSQIRDWYRDPRPDMLGPGCIKHTFSTGSENAAVIYTTKSRGSVNKTLDSRSFNKGENSSENSIDSRDNLIFKQLPEQAK
jgi:hypothetical protein